MFDEDLNITMLRSNRMSWETGQLVTMEANFYLVCHYNPDFTASTSTTLLDTTSSTFSTANIVTEQSTFVSETADRIETDTTASTLSTTSFPPVTSSAQPVQSFSTIVATTKLLQSTNNNFITGTTEIVQSTATALGYTVATTSASPMSKLNLKNNFLSPCEITLVYCIIAIDSSLQTNPQNRIPPKGLDETISNLRRNLPSDRLGGK